MVYGLRHQRPNFDGYVYIHYAVPPYSACISTIYFPRLATFGWVWFAVRNAWQRSRMQNLWRVGENSDTLSRLWTKVHEIFRQCRKPSYFPMSFSDCLCQVSFRRYLPLSLEVVVKRSKCNSFWPQFLWEGRPRLFCGSLLGRSITWKSLVEFRLLIFVCEAWQWIKMQDLRMVCKNAGRVLSRLWTKVNYIFG